MTANRDWAALVGRILLALIFVQSGWEKLMDLGGTAAYVASAGLPTPTVAAYVAMVVELLGGALLIVGFQARLAGLVLALFTLVAAFGFHRYWSSPPAEQLMQYLNFWKNISIAGGMFMVFALGPGRLSIDRG